MGDDSEGGGSAPASSSSSSSRARRGRGRGLTFINAAHPADALSRQALSSIRAHVARDAHARGRRGRTRAAVPRTEPGKSGRPSPPPSGGRAQQASGPPSEYGAEASGAAAAAAGAGGVEQEEHGVGLAPLAAAEELAAAAASASAMWREAEVAQSLAALNTRLDDVAWSWDPFRSFARPVSDTEAFLIDHYVNYAIRYDRVCCQNADRALRVILRSAWVPFALSDEGALAALLMQACRSVLWLLPRRRRAAQGPEAASWAGATTTVPPPPPAATPAAAEAYYSRLMLVYKGLCIRSVNASLSREWPHVSDATIAKSMIMGTEEYFHPSGSRGTRTAGWRTRLPSRAWRSSAAVPRASASRASWRAVPATASQRRRVSQSSALISRCGLAAV
ncbi:hypothetical protein RB594_004177 [Gaeumannomyces avenae]